MTTTSIPMTTSSTMTADSQALALSVVAELAATATPTAFSNGIKHRVADIPVANNNGKVQRFVQKLWKIVNSKSVLVGWSADGLKVVVRRPKDFAKRILPRYFNTSNMSSFTRQLHFYGFKKTLTANRSRADNWECQHEYFVRNHPEWLARITRKRCNIQMASQEETSQLRKEVDELREMVAQQQKQMQSMAAMLLALNSTHHTDRKRKATSIARPNQEARVQQFQPSLPASNFENRNEHFFFTPMQDHPEENKFENLFGLPLDDLGDIEDLTTDDFNYWS